MLKKALSYINLPNTLVSLFIIRLLITGTSIGDSIAMLGLLGLYGFYYYQESKKEVPINETVKLELEACKKDISLLVVELNNIKSLQNTVKAAQNLKSANNTFKF